MADDLAGRTIAFLATDGVEQDELIQPWEAVRAAGGEPLLVSPTDGTIQGFRALTPADTFTVDRSLEDVDAASFDGLVLPGGVANPDALRTDERAVAFARAFMDSATPVAAICHGPWLLVEADAVRGRTVTSWPSLQTDLRNAGATWINETVVVCTSGPSVLVTSREPADLPAFDDAVVQLFRPADPTGIAR